MVHTVQREIEGRTLSIEYGKMARQAAGAVSVSYGGTVVLAAVTSAPVRPGVDAGFLPLTVDYREKGYAAGMIFGGRFYRREGRPTEKETLTMRLIDRPVRPLFPAAFCDDVLITAIVLSADPENEPDVLAVIATSAALAVSNLPFRGPLGACRIGLLEGQFRGFPTHQMMQASRLNLVVASRRDGVVMVEAGASGVDEETAIRAIDHGRSINNTICDMLDELAAAAGVTQAPPPEDPVPAAADRFLALYREPLAQALVSAGKLKRRQGLRELEEQFIAAEAAETPGDSGKLPLDLAPLVFSEMHRRVMRSIVLAGRRIDGRRCDQVREISCEVGLLPRTHGSALFTRGETQALVTTTLGTADDEQLYESLSGERAERFLMHYNFPSFSVGEVKPPRGPSRREIGHGALARRALEPFVPGFEEFPYVVRVVSDILESNGSSSMATVCGASLSLMDAGVPVKQAVAGIAMGLVLEGGRSVVLTDILGDEDQAGDMDFKVAGSADGISALQMDIKTPGVSSEQLLRALQQARAARLEVLEAMGRTIAAPRPDIAEHAPKIIQMTIAVDKIGKVIGPAGSVIKRIEQETNTEIVIADDGLVSIYGSNKQEAERARLEVEKLAETPVVGRIYNAQVKGIKDFGAFVEILPGVEGLVHVSEFADAYIEDIKKVAKLNDRFPVKLIAVDEQGRLRLSKKAAEKELGVATAAGDPAGDPVGEPPAAETNRQRPPRRQLPPRLPGRGRRTQT